MNQKPTIIHMTLATARMMGYLEAKVGDSYSRAGYPVDREGSPISAAVPIQYVVIADIEPEEVPCEG